MKENIVDGSIRRKFYSFFFLWELCPFRSPTFHFPMIQYIITTHLKPLNRIWISCNFLFKVDTLSKYAHSQEILIWFFSERTKILMGYKPSAQSLRTLASYSEGLVLESQSWQT